MKTKLGQSEQQVLQYVQEKGPISVGEAAKHFADTQGAARTTVLTMMERLRKKGLLTRKLVDGVYEYSAKLAKETWVRQQVGDFVQSTLGGLVSPLVAYLGEAKLSEKELSELESLVKGLSAERGSRGKERT